VQQRNSRKWRWGLAVTLAMTVACTQAEEVPVAEEEVSHSATDDEAAFRALAERLRAEPSWDRAELSERLHGLDLYPKLKRGRQRIKVAVGYGRQTRVITLRIPRGYTPDRPWPLIYALHPSGGTGPSFLPRVEKLLGNLVEEFILAAPTHYYQTVLDAPPPFTSEHPVMLREIRRTVHVDSDRIYLLGYSLGGYAAWTLAMLHADEIAGSVPISSAYSLPADVEGLWRAFTPNFAEVPILHVWGGRDGLAVPGFEGRDQHSGTMSSLNRRFSPLIRKWGLNVIDHQVPRAGHGGAEPRRDQLLKILEHERTHYPRKVGHLFRHIHQARAYWLEGHSWEGDHWGEPGRRIKPRKGESRAAAYGRVILPLLGELRGEIDGQVIRIRRRHVADLTLWFGDGMIDWQQPVTVELDGKKIFAGRVEPDLDVCLSQAARTGDFDRLRWAGLWIDGNSQVRRVRSSTEFPPLIREP